MFLRSATMVALCGIFLTGCSPDQDDGGSAGPGEGQATQQANALLEDVIEAMGAAGVESIVYTGRAWRIRNGFMQTPRADPPWSRRDEITNYRRTIELDVPASLAQGDTYARNLFLDPPTEGIYTRHIAAEDTGWSDRLEIWLTPWGFLEGARENGVVSSSGRLDGVEYRVLSWMSPPDQTSPSGMRYTVNGFINDDDLIAGVETWVEHPFMGDFHVAQVYRNYRDIDGRMIPQTIEQQRGGGGVFGVIVEDATANPNNLRELMAAAPRARNGAGGGGDGRDRDADDDLIEQVGQGVWLVTGGYVALVAEFEDHVMVFEAGQSEARGEQILAEVGDLLPDKPVRYLVNSHPHSDHTAGIVPFIRNGTTLITHENNVDFLEMALGTPRSLLGEEPLEPEIVGVDGITVYEDRVNRVELHSVPNGHTDGMLVAILPRQDILFQADFTLPQPGNDPNPFVVTLAQYVAEVDPDFERYLAVHAAQEPQTKADLLATIGL